MRALLSLDISDNQLMYSPNGEAKAAGKALADALAENTVLTVLDVSSNCMSIRSENDGAGFALLLAAGLENNVALTKLVLKDNMLLTVDGGKALSCIISVNTTLKELDVSSNNWLVNDALEGDGPGFAKSFAIGLIDNGAILSVDLLENYMGIDQAQALVDILKGHPTLKSLCGNSGDETELVMSGKLHGAEDAIMLAAEIIDNEALTSLDISKQDNRYDNQLDAQNARGGWPGQGQLGAEGAKHLAGALKDHA
jgi:hypothetical protein